LFFKHSSHSYAYKSLLSDIKYGPNNEPQWWFIVEGVGAAHKVDSSKSQLQIFQMMMG